MDVKGDCYCVFHTFDGSFSAIEIKNGAIKDPSGNNNQGIILEESCWSQNQLLDINNSYCIGHLVYFINPNKASLMSQTIKVIQRVGKDDIYSVDFKLNLLNPELIYEECKKYIYIAFGAWLGLPKV